jgi:hypothetical protein
MAEKENKTPNVFGGFEALSKSLLGGGSTSSDKDSEIPYVDPEELMDKDEDTDDDIKEDVIDNEKPDKPEKVVPPKETKQKEVPAEEDTEEDESGSDDVTDEDEDIETEVTGFLKDRLAEELGWELDEDNKFESIKDIVDYMKEVVDENSKPKYHSDDVKALDEYVKNGGSIDQYFKEVYGANAGIDYDTVDLTREGNQRLVIKELLKQKGYTPDRIQRTIERYEKSETLEEEANDAVDLLKEYKSENAKKLLDQQKKQAADNIKQQQMFFENVQTNIKSLENIRGIKISSKEKNELLDYIFKPDSEGLTKYQRDYMSDIKNLIESAYFTKKGDSLIAEAQKKGSSDAYKEFHQKLKANKGKRSKNSGSLESGSDSDSILSSLSKSLLNKV